MKFHWEPSCSLLTDRHDEANGHSSQSCNCGWGSCIQNSYKWCEYLEGSSVTQHEECNFI